MPELRNLNIPPPTDDDRFEFLCLELWRRILEDPHVQPNGRRGQRQHGVDLIGRKNGTDWVGVQCKVRSNGNLTESDITGDVQKAKDFNPRLSELVFATTARRDEKIQEIARTVTSQNQEAGLFGVYVVSWDDILLHLSTESNLDLCRRFYSDFFINYENLGISIWRILRISIGVGFRADTTYEIMLGKTPSPGTSDSYLGLDYWRGQYFLANLHTKALDNFPKEAFASDLERLFPTMRDAYIVAKWLSELPSIDDVINGDDGNDEEHVKLLSEEEYDEFLKSIRDD